MHTPAAPKIAATGPNALAQPSARKVRLYFTESEAAQFGFLDRWLAVLVRRERRALKSANMKQEFAALFSRLLAHAGRKEWSQRRLAKEIGLSWGGFRRCRDGTAEARRWLPKLQAAIARLKAG